MINIIPKTMYKWLLILCSFTLISCGKGNVIQPVNESINVLIGTSQGSAFHNKNILFGTESIQSYLEYSYINASAADSRGNIYFGTNSGNLWVLNHETNEFNRIINSLNGNQSNGSLDGYSINVILSQPDSIYIGTQYGHVYKLSNNKLTNLCGNTQMNQCEPWVGDSNAPIVSLVMINNILYAATTSNVWMFQNNVWNIVPNNPLSAPQISSIAVSPDGVIYEGSSDGLVYRYNHNDFTWTLVGGGEPIGQIGCSVVSMTVYNTKLVYSCPHIDKAQVYELNLNNTWDILLESNGYSVNQVIVEDNTLYATASDGKVLYYVSANNWQTIGNAIDGVIDPQNISNITISNGVIFASANDANANSGSVFKFNLQNSVTWSYAGTGSIDGNGIVSSAIDSFGTRYVGTMNATTIDGNIWKLAIDGISWEDIGIESIVGSGVAVVELQTDDNDNLYALNTNAQLWKHDSNLDEWNILLDDRDTLINGEEISYFAIYESNIFVGTTDGYIWTESNGVWYQLNPDTLGIQIDYIFVNSTNLYVSSKNTNTPIWSYGNNSWTQLSDIPKNPDYDYAPTSVNSMAAYNGVLYVGISYTISHGVIISQIYKYYNNSWSIVGNGGIPDDSEITSLQIDNYGNILVSNLNGNIWKYNPYVNQWENLFYGNGAPINTFSIYK